MEARNQRRGLDAGDKMKTVLENGRKPISPKGGGITGPGPGHPKGMKNKKTIVKEAIALDATGHFGKRWAEDNHAIIDKLFELALKGIPWAMQMVIDRGLGKVKEFVEVSTPDTELTIKVIDIKQ